MYGIFLTFPNINFPVRPIGKQNITALTSEHLSTIYFNHSQTSYRRKKREALCFSLFILLFQSTIGIQHLSSYLQLLLRCSYQNIFLHLDQRLPLLHQAFLVHKLYKYKFYYKMLKKLRKLLLLKLTLLFS